MQQLSQAHQTLQKQLVQYLKNFITSKVNTNNSTNRTPAVRKEKTQNFRNSASSPYWRSMKIRLGLCPKLTDVRANEGNKVETLKMCYFQ